MSAGWFMGYFRGGPYEQDYIGCVVPALNGDGHMAVLFDEAGQSTVSEIRCTTEEEARACIESHYALRRIRQS